MAKGSSIILWGFVVCFFIIFGLWYASIKGYIPITYKEIKTTKEFIRFLSSPRDDMRGIKINQHLLNIGKRRSLQILRDYKRPFYMVRPYRQINLIPVNMTKAEVVDFCLNISGNEFNTLKGKVNSKKDVDIVWKGKVRDYNIELVRITLFSYFVYGLKDRPLFMAQVELAKKLGMPENEIMARIIPVQDQWYASLVLTLDTSSPIKQPLRDELIAWIEG
ncbi:MAG: hypothetical protein J7L53_12570 [Deltaproteobacteria bacterium]|nr:hypothetical protein [Deltaproteobacteria bacterium]